MTGGFRSRTPVFDAAKEADVNGPRWDDCGLINSSGQSDLCSTAGHGRANSRGKVTGGVNIPAVKLHQLVDDKDPRAFVRGPTASSTQQPAGGKARSAASVSARWGSGRLEAYGAAYTLQEC